MDLNAALTDAGLLEDQGQLEQPELPNVFVCQTPEKPTESDFFEFVAVTNIYDTSSRKPGVIFTFDPHDQRSLDALALICGHPAVFDANIIVIEGVPNTVITPAWRDAVIKAASYSYNALVTDLTEAQRTADLLAQEGKTAFDKERDQVTDREGKIKDMRDVHVTTGDDDGVVDDDPGLLS